MASPGNRHCANCIGALSFSMPGSPGKRQFFVGGGERPLTMWPFVKILCPFVTG